RAGRRARRPDGHGRKFDRAHQKCRASATGRCDRAHGPAGLVNREKDGVDSMTDLSSSDVIGAADDARRPVRRALISVYDKTGIADLAVGLAAAGVEIVSTGSTA